MDERIKAVIFNEEEHSYWYQGRELHGVTGAIGKLMGKQFPDTDTVKLATIYGKDVHSEVEHYFNDNDYYFPIPDKKLSTEGAQWVVDSLKDFCNEVPASLERVECEVMVSDFEGTASKVDVVVRARDGRAWLFDIKTTSSFDRPYCSLQLSVYKKLYEANYGGTVEGMYVLGTKARRRFRIINQPAVKVDKILDMNKPKEV